MSALANLYDFLLFAQGLDAPDRRVFDPTYLIEALSHSPRGEARFHSIMYPEGLYHQLECTLVSYNSPGLQEFRGAAETVRSLFDIIRDVIFLKRGREIHDLEVLERRERIKYAAVARLERTAIILRDAGVPLATAQRVILSACEDLSILDRIGDTGGIVKIELVDENQQPLDARSREIAKE